MLLLAAQIHPNALIGLGIAIGAGAAFNNRVFAIGQCAAQLFVLGLLGAELFAHRGEFLLFGADGDLALDQSKKQRTKQCRHSQGKQTPRNAFVLVHAAAPPSGQVSKCRCVQTIVPPARTRRSYAGILKYSLII